CRRAEPAVCRRAVASGSPSCGRRRPSPLGDRRGARPRRTLLHRGAALPAFPTSPGIGGAPLGAERPRERWVSTLALGLHAALGARRGRPRRGLAAGPSLARALLLAAWIDHFHPGRAVVALDRVAHERAQRLVALHVAEEHLQ